MANEITCGKLKAEEKGLDLTDDKIQQNVMAVKEAAPRAVYDHVSQPKMLAVEAKSSNKVLSASFDQKHSAAPQVPNKLKFVTTKVNRFFREKPQRGRKQPD